MWTFRGFHGSRGRFLLEAGGRFQKHGGVGKHAGPRTEGRERDLSRSLRRCKIIPPEMCKRNNADDLEGGGGGEDLHRNGPRHRKCWFWRQDTGNAGFDARGPQPADKIIIILELSRRGLDAVRRIQQPPVNESPGGPRAGSAMGGGGRYQHFAKHMHTLP
jgi:hypothetical protein